MLGIAGLQHHGHHAGVNFRLLGLTVVVDADYIGAGLRHLLQKRVELARLVGDLGGELSDTAGLGEAAGDDSGKYAHVNIAAGHQAHCLFAAGVDLVEHGRRHAGGACSLRHGLLRLHKSKDGRGYLIL